MESKAAATHEAFLQATRDIVISVGNGSIEPEVLEKLKHTKLVYGAGTGAYRGVCHYSAWMNGIGTVDVVEVAASAEESWVQLVGTTIHELSHVAAGHGAGHGAEWKAWCERLGLRRAKAAGHRYSLAGFNPKIREATYALAQTLGDGQPAFRTFGIGLGIGWVPRPCSAGIGTRGGTSRGKGSGSRLRLWECSCPVKVRVARDDFDATCNLCGTKFERR